MDPQMLRNHLQIFNIDGVRLVFKKNEKQKNETAAIKSQNCQHFHPPDPPQGGKRLPFLGSGPYGFCLGNLFKANIVLISIYLIYFNFIRDVVMLRKEKETQFLCYCIFFFPYFSFIK
jgi:hypothetical protein